MGENRISSCTDSTSSAGNRQGFREIVLVSSDGYNKHQSLGGLNNRNLVLSSHSSGSWESKIKVIADLAPGENLLFMVRRWSLSCYV